MKTVHGGKAKIDRIDAAKIAGLLRGGMFPMAFVYPCAMRETRDLLRRWAFFVRQKAQLITHITNTNSQYNSRTNEKSSPWKERKSTFRGHKRVRLSPLLLGLKH